MHAHVGQGSQQQRTLQSYLHTHAYTLACARTRRPGTTAPGSATEDSSIVFIHTHKRTHTYLCTHMSARDHSARFSDKGLFNRIYTHIRVHTHTCARTRRPGITAPGSATEDSSTVPGAEGRPMDSKMLATHVPTAPGVAAMLGLCDRQWSCTNTHNTHAYVMSASNGCPLTMKCTRRMCLQLQGWWPCWASV